MNYTKGEWKVNWTASTQDIEASIRPGKKGLVASVWFGHLYQVSQEEAEVNAHLIAAAPDMYEALKAIIADRTACHETEAAYIPPEIEMAYKSIAKAEGK